MTGPGEPSAPAGWYPDPDGAPGMVRWWNGLSWSDVTTPAGPGVTVQARPAVSAGPPGAPFPPQTPPRSGGGARVAWAVGLSVLGLVLVVVVALLVGRGGGTDAVAGGPTVADPPPSSGPTFAPGTVRIIDEEAGISYPFLGDGWYEYNLGPVLETTSVAGQFFTTQDVTPDGVFIAQCTSGPLAPEFGGVGDLRATVATVADSVRANYYPAPNERRVLRDEPVTVDGAPAHLFEFDLSWDVEGYDATGERAALVLIDVGRPAPALLYVSIPNTHAELYGVIDRVLADIDVL